MRAFCPFTQLASARALSRSGLLTGCAEVALNLLSPNEAVTLLLRTGEVDDADAGALAAAAEIAELCGFLPLYLGICGAWVKKALRKISSLLRALRLPIGFLGILRTHC